MIEQKLFRVQEGPEDVFIGFLFAFGSLVTGLAGGLLVEVCAGEFDFVGIGFAAEGDVVKVGDFIVVGPGVPGQRIGTAIAARELCLDLRGIKQVQALREAGFLGAFALASAGGIGAAEDTEEVGGLVVAVVG